MAEHLSKAARPLAEMWLILLALGVFVWVALQSVALIRADFLAMEARFRIQTWLDGSRNWNASEWVRLRDNLDAALQITPKNPNLHDSLGAYYGFRGSLGWRNDELRTMFFTEALRHQEASLHLRRDYAPAVANRALSHFALGMRGERLFSHLREALRLGPNEQPVQMIVSDIVLAVWADAPSDLQQRVRDIHAQALANERKRMGLVAQQYGVSLVD